MIVIGTIAGGSLIGLSVAHHWKARKRRQRIEDFVSKHTTNETVLNVVEEMTDQQIDKLNQMMDKMEDMRSKIYIEGNKIKALTKDILQQIGQ